MGIFGENVKLFCDFIIMVCLIDHRLRVCFPFTMKLVCCFCRGSTEDGSNESDHQESDEGAEVVVEDDDGAEELEELQEQEPGKGGGRCDGD